MSTPLGSSPAQITAAGTYELACASGSEPGTLVIQWVGSGLTLNTVARVGGPANAAAPFVAIPYVRRDLAGTAQDDTPVIADLTGNFIIKVDGSGLVVGLIVTGSGSGALYYTWLAGPDA